jgi:hypothetical protein
MKLDGYQQNDGSALSWADVQIERVVWIVGVVRIRPPPCVGIVRLLVL